MKILVEGDYTTDYIAQCGFCKTVVEVAEWEIIEHDELFNQTKQLKKDCPTCCNRSQALEFHKKDSIQGLEILDAIGG